MAAPEQVEALRRVARSLLEASAAFIDATDRSGVAYRDECEELADLWFNCADKREGELLA